MCLFFDQVNIYAKILCDRYAKAVPSTDLSTEFVDKPAMGKDLTRISGYRPGYRLLSRKLWDKVRGPVLGGGIGVAACPLRTVDSAA